ncbi:MAG TPA: alanine racemase, partial [Tenuifilaceae bacterium]|nr:alanine racemase [Tenuifilaceae bacterium]
MIKGTDTVKVKSMFSHLATSDEPDQDEFTLSQLTLFDKMTSQLSNSLGYNPIRHILNTGGIERFPDYQFDMVRLGIGLYGISTTAADSLRVVATLRSRIIQLKELKPGDTVGYSRRGVITRPSVVATIPVGYADGLNRRLGNGAGKFLVNGVLVPTIGNINMDTAVVDVTGVDVKVGDDIVIFGENPPITEIAKAIGTIPYEVLTSISRRVKRIYYNE